MDLSIAGEQTDGRLPTHRTLGGRALWWVGALLLAGMIAIVLPIGQIKIRGAQLGGIIGSYGGGYYKVSYSGGSFTVSPSSSTDPVPFSAVASGSTYDYGASVSVTGNNPSIVSSAKSTPTPSTPIVVTCTWMPSYPGEAPPDSVILQENSFSQAEAQSYNGGTPQLSVDDGLGQGDAATPGSNSLKSEGTRYSVLSSPGASFTVQVTPIASASLTGSPMPAPASSTSATTLMGFASCIIGYSLKPTVPTISLSGTTPITPSGSTHARPSILVGQQIVASVDAGNNTPVSYAWSSTGDPINTSFPDASHKTGHTILLGTDANGNPTNDLKAPSFKFFYRTIGEKNVDPAKDVSSKPQKISCDFTFTDPKGVSHTLTISTTVDVCFPVHRLVVNTGQLKRFTDNMGNDVFGPTSRLPDPTNPLDAGPVTSAAANPPSRSC